MKKKLIRVTTVPYSLGSLLKGQLKFMSQFYDVLAISSDGNGFLNEFHETEGIRVIPVEMTRKITPLTDLRATWKMYRIFKNEKPFIVHTHTPKAGTVGMVAAYFAGVPHRLHTIAGMPLIESTGAKRMLLNMVEKITYRLATKVYPNSFHMVDIVLENKFTSRKKLKVLGEGSSNGVDHTYFDPNLYSEHDNHLLRSSLGINDSDFVYLFIGRLVKDKGINELVAAFKTMAKEYDDTKLILVGTYEQNLNPITEETEKTIDENPNIITVGGKRDVRPYYAISDLLTFPSYREGFPNVVLETGSMGLPAIVTDINGCNEIIIDGKNGRIIAPKDVTALRKVMVELYEDRSKLEKMASHCREMITSRFDRQYMWSELLKEYKSLETNHHTR